MTITNETVEKLVRSLSVVVTYHCDCCGREEARDKEFPTTLPLGWYELFDCYGTSTKAHLCYVCCNSFIQKQKKLREQFDEKSQTDDLVVK